jgi:hypothetical protein
MQETDSRGGPLDGPPRHPSMPVLHWASIRGLLKTEMLRAPHASASLGHRICLHAGRAALDSEVTVALVPDAASAPGRQIPLATR